MNSREVEDQLLAAEVVVGTSVIDHVDRVVRDARSGRVWRLVTRCGTVSSRQVAVPIEWVARRQGRRIVLAVDTRSLDQLADYHGADRTYGAAATPGIVGGSLAATYVSTTT
jgi:hypothetical protein